MSVESEEYERAADKIDTSALRAALIDRCKVIYGTGEDCTCFLCRIDELIADMER